MSITTMGTSYVSTVDVTVNTSIGRIINRTLLLPINTPYLTCSMVLFFLLSAYLLWENKILQPEYVTGSASQFEGFLFYVTSTGASVLLILLSISKDILEENHRLNTPISLPKVFSALACWCLLGLMSLPTVELYGNEATKGFIRERHLSIIDFIPDKPPAYSSSSNW